MGFLARISCRFWIIAVLATAMVVAVAHVRPPEGQFGTGLSREKFWLVKLRAPATYDLVLAGDSRTLCDLDPASMEQVLRRQRVLNFGFNVVALTPDYLQAAADKLDPSSAMRTLLIGITPRALTPVNAKLSGYDEEKNRDWDEKVFNWAMDPVNSPLRPIMPAAMLQYVLGTRVSYKDFFPNGWMSVSLRPADSTADLGVYRRIFVRNQISPKMYDAFLGKVRQLAASGIRVRVVRLPIAPGLFDQEETKSGFDEQALIRDLHANGAEWVASPPGPWVITDGSHIDAASAPEYSRRLAERLAPARILAATIGQ